MSANVYEAKVHTAHVEYINFKGERQSADVMFALDPVTMLGVISRIKFDKSRSANPQKRNEQTMSDSASIELVQDLVSTSAGWPSEDGESWEKYENFNETLAGQAFLTKLTSSDAERKEFVRNVMLTPMRAFIGFARLDKTNSPAEIQELEATYANLEKVFNESLEENRTETLEERRERLQRELAETEG